MSHSLYVHIPLCIKKCGYCDFFSDPSCLGSEDAIVDALIRETHARAQLHQVTEWDTVYIGGGTPSILLPRAITALTDGIRCAAPVSQNAEWTIEANPEDISEKWLSACATCGINRLSLGIQSMADTELSAVGRRGSRASNLLALHEISRSWSGTLSLDLIAGLPGQTPDTLGQTLESVLCACPDHVSLYSLTIEEGTPLELSVRKGSVQNLPAGDEADNLWIRGRDMLQDAGFAQYEVSNFCRQGYESRHNLVYWNLGDWIGAGPSASGTVRSGNSARRCTGTGNIAKWLDDPIGSSFDEILTTAECERESLIMGMRLRTGLERERFELRYGRDILELIPKSCSLWTARGLLNVDRSRIALTGEGLLLLNAFLRECMEEMD